VNQVDVTAITRHRLEDWGTDCIRDHATPALLLAIGHDHVSGEAHIYVPDDPFFDQKRIAQMLQLALRELGKR
jgi:hypothetical protein